MEQQFEKDNNMRKYLNLDEISKKITFEIDENITDQLYKIWCGNNVGLILTFIHKEEEKFIKELNGYFGFWYGDGEICLKYYPKSRFMDEEEYEEMKKLKEINKHIDTLNREVE